MGLVYMCVLVLKERGSIMQLRVKTGTVASSLFPTSLQLLRLCVRVCLIPEVFHHWEAPSEKVVDPRKTYLGRNKLLWAKIHMVTPCNCKSHKFMSCNKISCNKISLSQSKVSLKSATRLLLI